MMNDPITKKDVLITGAWLLGIAVIVWLMFEGLSLMDCAQCWP